MSEKPKHSIIGASSMHRWEPCPGSVKLSQGMPNNSSIYAQLGTATHELIGLSMEQAFGEGKPTTEVLKNHFDAMIVYSDYIEKIKADDPDCAVHIEHKFDMSFIFPDLYGQADTVIWHKKQKLLRVIDYKHGAGLPVEAQNNRQISYYGLGAITTLGYKPMWVELTIVQPRCYHPSGSIRTWTVPNIYFIDFKADLIAAAKATLKKNARRKAGGHCIFCPAKTVCPEKLKSASAGFKKESAFYSDPKNDFQVIA